ncbi:replication initiation protein [Enterococcus faecalis]|nr:replication initiation protein [Enterococcus faecalis]EHB6464182.1 replication initiation protein [Enterococcus faecalis]MDT2166606.1 replication initiation protein [Enterococcus faecalis]RTK48523.1 replication initiation protein [Enterococcus faecalis]
MNEVIKYHNDLNTVIMRKWTAEEMNFFFAIIAKARNQGVKELHFNTDEIKKLVNFTQKDEKRWKEAMKSTARKVTQLTYFEDDGKKFKVMPLFSLFEVDYEEKTVKVEVSKHFEYILNRLEVQFTQYELEEFTNIRSTYAKTMYRLLKQWRTVGKKEYGVNELRVFLDVPESYSNGEVTRRVLEPIQKELSNYFLNFKYKVIKSNKRGNPVLGYEFTWKPEKTGEWEDNKYKKNDFYKAKKVESNVPNWVEKEYKHSATAEEQAKLEELRRRMSED